MATRRVPDKAVADGLSDVREAFKVYSASLLELAKEQPRIAQVINQGLGIAMQSLTLSFQGLVSSQEDLSSELRACIDEVAKDYAEYETTELKRRFDQVIEQHKEKIERQAEALESIQDQLRKGLDSNDSN